MSAAMWAALIANLLCAAAVLLAASWIDGRNKLLWKVYELTQKRVETLNESWDGLLLLVIRQHQFIMGCLPKERLTADQRLSLAQMEKLAAVLQARVDALEEQLGPWAVFLRTGKVARA